MSEVITGTLDKLDTRLDWLVKFSLTTSQGTLWLGAKTKEHKALADALVKQDNFAPDDRPMWEMEYNEEQSEGKDGKVYTNRWVTSAKTIATPSPAKANGGGGKDAAIARAVAFKGVIDLLVSTKPKGDLKKVSVVVNQLTNEFESILDRTYVDGGEALLDEAKESDDVIFEEEI
jgi:hypothetical protein